MPIFGIEVSKYNGNINYADAKRAGVRFAMVRAGKGENPDRRFEQNVEGFHSVGIPVGAYHIFTGETISECYAQAQDFISITQPYRDKIILPLACVADAHTNLTQSERTSLAHMFLSRVSASGFGACICTDGTDTYFVDNLAIHTYTRNGQLVGVVGEFACAFAFEPITRLIIKWRTDITDDTLDYISAHESGENILARLADMLVAKSIKPLKNPSHERIVPLLRLCCKLTSEECAHLCAYRWGEEVIRELYSAMVR